MIWLLLFIVVGTVMFFVSSSHQAKVKASLAQKIADFGAAHAGWEIFMAENSPNPMLLAVGSASRQISLGTLEDHIDVAWGDISRVEVESNGTSLTTTNRGSQLLGGVVGNVLLGPMGLLIGGVTGSKATRERVNSLALKIVVEHSSRPTHRIIFFRKGGKGAKPNGWILKGAAERLEHFHALLLNAMRAVEREHDHRLPTPTSELPDVEHRIARLWELRQAGALTQQEFDERKQSLLGGAGLAWPGQVPIRARLVQWLQPGAPPQGNGAKRCRKEWGNRTAADLLRLRHVWCLRLGQPGVALRRGL